MYPLATDSAITFFDLTGKLGWLNVTCDKCGREGRYSVLSLIDAHGPNCRVADLVNAITANCTNNRSADTSDQCGARCPDLAEIF